MQKKITLGILLIQLMSHVTVKAMVHIANEPALYAAAKVGDLAEVKAFISAGADLNVYGVCGTPLGIAACRGHVQVVKALLDAGAVINRGEFYGGDALRSAIGFCKPEVVKVLLAYRADLAGRNQPDGLTYLGYAKQAFLLEMPETIRPEVFAVIREKRAQIVALLEKQLEQNRSLMI